MNRTKGVQTARSKGAVVDDRTIKQGSKPQAVGLLIKLLGGRILPHFRLFFISDYTSGKLKGWSSPQHS